MILYDLMQNRRHVLAETRIGTEMMVVVHDKDPFLTHMCVSFCLCIVCCLLVVPGRGHHWISRSINDDFCGKDTYQHCEEVRLNNNDRQAELLEKIISSNVLTGKRF